tara:strand:- start:1993 stop:2322 length:330 start_codon:yes stop_codon:yes gene_type:complete
MIVCKLDMEKDMEIFYKNSDCEPWEGDVRILASGKKQIRVQSRYNGAFVVSNGRPVCDWHDYDDPDLVTLRERYESNKHRYYQKKNKPRGTSIHFSKRNNSVTVRVSKG